MNLLTLDGGGYRGLFSAHLLSRIEEHLGAAIISVVKFIAGTSTGGIIACALASGIPAARIRDFYINKVSGVFHKSRKRRLVTLGGTLGSKYSSKGLLDALEGVLGGVSLYDARVPLLVPSFDLNTKEAFFFKSYREEEPFTMVDAAMGTSSAPTYFNPYDVFEYKLIDGGIHSNNPAVSAMADAYRYFPDQWPFKVLSIGTGGSGNNNLIPKYFGTAGWARVIVPLFMGSSSSVVSYQAEQVLGDNYMRINTDMSSKLDDTSKKTRERILDAAESAWRSNHEQIMEFLL